LSIGKAYRENLTRQPDNQSLTIIFVGDFSFLARFLLGFEGFYDMCFNLNGNRWWLTPFCD
jgi:hypothetical protein